MPPDRKNAYLDHGSSDESDNDAGYDSEAAEISKTGRASKRRKTEHEYTDDDADEVIGSSSKSNVEKPSPVTAEEARKLEDETATPSDIPQSTAQPHKKDKKSKSKSNSKEKEAVPGVIYLSSLPPYLKPSALRNLLEQRGFHPIKRLFLSPASKHKSTSKKNSRQLYTEGWIEFDSKKTARRCAETLNATTVGGRKGGWYHDDVWNMKYLRGMGWEELMAGVREEKREEEGRRDEERRVIARETKSFVEGVEEGRRVEGMKRKREGKAAKIVDEGERKEGGEGDVKRTWRQVEVKGRKGGSENSGREKISDDVKQVLGKIF